MPARPHRPRSPQRSGVRSAAAAPPRPARDDARDAERETSTGSRSSTTTPRRTAERAQGAPAASRPLAPARPAARARADRAAVERDREAEPVEGSTRASSIIPADRFRDLLRARPWRRRRRAILGTLAGLVVLALLALAGLVFLPFFHVQDVAVSGTTYVDSAAVRSAVASGTGRSELLLPTGDLEKKAAGIPGVKSARVERSWPHGMRVRVTERTPLAKVTDASGKQTVVDAEGVQLPAAAGEKSGLAALTVADGSTHPRAATSAMLEVLAALPSDLRAKVTGITASGGSDVSLAVHTEGGDKTVVWGDADDSELKAKVLAALIDTSAGTIDVTSPIAPVTR